jgi:response regulator RpfG family c-di-GMP phosphodiesterase
MYKVLLVDDDDAMRGLLRMRLSDQYNIVDTGNPEEALALGLEEKPDVILLDLMMPKFSGFELCQSFRSLSYTSRIPIFVVSGEAGSKYRKYCEDLGATAYFEKPVDFEKLRARLQSEMETKHIERRAQVRVRMRIVLKIEGTDANGKEFEVLTATENLSAGGFLCSLVLPLTKDSQVNVYLGTGVGSHFGRARVVRRESPNTPWQRYAFAFEGATTDWVMQST